ncbi:hypothetical protein F4703DRAFT_1144528 [Phycomyces blakesleeanus]
MVVVRILTIIGSRILIFLFLFGTPCSSSENKLIPYLKAYFQNQKKEREICRDDLCFQLFLSNLFPFLTISYLFIYFCYSCCCYSCCCFPFLVSIIIIIIIIIVIVIIIIIIINRIEGLQSVYI